MSRASARAGASSAAFRVVTGAVVRMVDGRTLKPSGWSAFLTVAPFGRSGDEKEGSGTGGTPRAALDRAVADLASQGAFDEKEAGRC